MTVLQALDGYYDRMAARGEAEPPGYSREKISFRIVLSPGGEPVQVIDLRQLSGRRLVPQLLEVPAAVKRTVAIVPNLLWDKTSYALGRTAGEGRRTADEHARFRLSNLDLVTPSDDTGLVAFRRFLETWSPARFDEPPFTIDMLDANVVFALDGERGDLHERGAARRLIEARIGGDGPVSMCLVTGALAPVARLHRPIKGVQGAQSSGATLVSFNLDAFTSYGKAQGDNAPTSEAAVFRYGAALNRMLDRSSDNRLRRPVGDATVVFWADASGVGLKPEAAEVAAVAVEELFDHAIDPPEDQEEAASIRDALEYVAAGRPIADLRPDIAPGTRFHVLGLSPNAARLSVRFWESDDFEVFAQRLAQHYADLRIEPAPWSKPPSINYLLARTTALQQKFENIPPHLAGEVMRAVLTGAPYPRSLLTAALVRLRAGDNPATGWHAAVIKACLARYSSEETPPVALDPDNPDPAYQLGRLFAVLEAAQYAALGRVNASIADRYYGAASATPARVFGALMRGARTHISDAKKRNRGRWIDGRIEEILSHLSSPNLPRSLRMEDQGRFAVGYYHERGARPRSVEAGSDDEQANGEEA